MIQRRVDDAQIRVQDWISAWGFDQKPFLMKFGKSLGPSAIGIAIGCNRCTIHLGQEAKGAQLLRDSLPLFAGFALNMLRAARNLRLWIRFLAIDAIGSLRSLQQFEFRRFWPPASHI